MHCKICLDTKWVPSTIGSEFQVKCAACCKHEEGWWQLTEDFMGYIPNTDNACCRAGCGTMRRDLYALDG